ncbi:MAG: bifunctional 4-hydroxy-2-oxoglutarate aldolase/2-dehydro-3-deoxy-phosphogluconate aldolase [Planctomycetota bacterium]
MDACDVKRRIVGCGLVAMVRTTSAADARTVAAALAAGGVEIIEITMTVPGALAVLEGLAKEFGADVVVGAGTVLDAETARAAVLAGAQFVVTPSLSEEAIRVTKRYGKLACPGALTPTEIVRALECGADLVKVFPVDCVGGPEYIRAIKAPLPQADLVPTGGVTLENAADHIRAGATALGVGSALVDKKALAEGKPEVLTEKARRFVDAVQAARK